MEPERDPSNVVIRQQRDSIEAQLRIYNSESAYLSARETFFGSYNFLKGDLDAKKENFETKRDEYEKLVG